MPQMAPSGSQKPTLVSQIPTSMSQMSTSVSQSTGDPPAHVEPSVLTLLTRSQAEANMQYDFAELKRSMDAVVQMLTENDRKVASLIRVQLPPELRQGDLTTTANQGNPDGIFLPTLSLSKEDLTMSVKPQDRNAEPRQRSHSGVLLKADTVLQRGNQPVDVKCLPDDRSGGLPEYSE